MYTPLKQTGTKVGHRVGIAGCGGLGHIGVKLAKSMGAEVIVLTHTPEKLQDSLELGADKALLVAGFSPPYLKLLKPQRILWIVGSMYTMPVDFDKVNRKGKIIRGSSTAGIGDTQECIDYCVANNIYPDVERALARHEVPH